MKRNPYNHSVEDFLVVSGITVEETDFMQLVIRAIVDSASTPDNEQKSEQLERIETMFHRQEIVTGVPFDYRFFSELLIAGCNVFYEIGSHSRPSISILGSDMPSELKARLTSLIEKISNKKERPDVKEK